MDDRLLKIQRAIDTGNDADARSLLNDWDTKPLMDPQKHLALGRISQQLGGISRAIIEFNFALRDDPQCVKAIQEIAWIRVDRGEIERAIRAFRKWLELDPDSCEAMEGLGSAMIEAGMYADAFAFFDDLEGNHADLAQAGKRRVKAAESAASQGTSRSSFEPETAFTPTESDAITFAHRFAGREGVHARQWTSTTGKAGYTPVEEPFTPAVAKAHLAGSITAGIYPLRHDNSVNFLAFDIDVVRFTKTSHDETHALLKLTHRVAKQLIDVTASLDIPAYIEDSGWKGRHVWVFFEPPIPGSGVRRLASRILETLGEPPPEMRIEVFPKQGSVRGDGYGNLIKLPLGIHKVTGRRCWFLQPDGSPHPSGFAVIHDLQPVSRETARRLIDHPTRATQRFTKADIPTETKPPAIPIEAERPAYRLEHDPEVQWLLNRCPVLADIVRTVTTTGILSQHAQAVITYTLGHLEHGPDAVNTLLQSTLSADTSAFLNSRLRGKPMSCPKIRHRLSDVANQVDCNCQFDPGIGAYPTPLLHLTSLRTRGAVGTAPTDLTRLQVERLVTDLIRTRIDIDRLKRLAADLEARLADYLHAQKLDELQTPAGTIRHDPNLNSGLTLTFGHPPAPDSNKNDDHPIRDGAGGRDQTPEGPADRQ